MFVVDAVVASVGGGLGGGGDGDDGGGGFGSAQTSSEYMYVQHLAVCFCTITCIRYDIYDLQAVNQCLQRGGTKRGRERERDTGVTYV